MEMAEESGQKIEEHKKAEEQLKGILRLALEEDAYTRLMNVKLANESMFMAAAQHVLAVFKRFGRKLNQNELLMILRRLKEGEEKKTTITFSRK